MELYDKNIHALIKITTHDYFTSLVLTFIGEMWKSSKKLSPNVSERDASISSACSSSRSLFKSCDWQRSHVHINAEENRKKLSMLWPQSSKQLQTRWILHQYKTSVPHGKIQPSVPVLGWTKAPNYHDALLYLLSVSLGISHRREQSQQGCQKILINLHGHLLNQGHEVPESAKTGTLAFQQEWINLNLTTTHIKQVNTNLNCMTVLCLLNRVMIDTSMKGFGSVTANTFLEMTKKL